MDWGADDENEPLLLVLLYLLRVRYAGYSSRINPGHAMGCAITPFRGRRSLAERSHRYWSAQGVAHSLVTVPVVNDGEQIPPPLIMTYVHVLNKHLRFSIGPFFWSPKTPTAWSLRLNFTLWLQLCQSRYIGAYMHVKL